MSTKRLIRATLRECRGGILFGVLSTVLFCTVLLLYRQPIGTAVYPALLSLVLGGVLLCVRAAKIRRLYGQLSAVQQLTAAMIEALPPARSVEGEEYRRLIFLLTRQQNEQEHAAEARYRSMVDYYTVWAHQIKTPIAAMHVILQNEDTPLSRQLTSELFRIEQYADMVLAFLRLGASSTDYVFREHDLDGVLRGAIRRFAPEFIGRQIRLDYRPPQRTVLTDDKWLSFVLEQLLSNALKYTPSGSVTVRTCTMSRLSAGAGAETSTGSGMRRASSARSVSRLFAGTVPNFTSAGRPNSSPWKFSPAVSTVPPRRTNSCRPARASRFRFLTSGATITLSLPNFRAASCFSLMKPSLRPVAERVRQAS